MTSPSSLVDQAWREVVALHAFFESWLREGGHAGLDFSEAEAAIGRDFRMVSPDGTIGDREEIVSSIRGERGTREPDFRIIAVDPKAVWAGDGAVLLEYTEQQYRAGRTTRRRSTALFLADPAAPRGVVWRHLQETWMLSD
jgi:hypothetical protein